MTLSVINKRLKQVRRKLSGGFQLVRWYLRQSQSDSECRYPQLEHTQHQWFLGAGVDRKLNVVEGGPHALEAFSADTPTAQAYLAEGAR